MPDFHERTDLMDLAETERPHSNEPEMWFCGYEDSRHEY